jgi:hypothetical protein
MTTTTLDASPTRSSRRRLLTLGGGVLAVLVIVAAVVLWRSHGKDEKVPYDDPQAAGLLTLCSADGKAVTGGKVGVHPFVGAVLGRTGVPSGVDPKGAVATLFAYQPRIGVEVSEFSGTPITAAGALTDPARPAVAVTKDAWSVGDFVTAFPATDDGYVQLRLYLGTADAGTLTENPYDTADLRVDGDSWALVRGGSASCAGTSALLP